MNSIIGRIALSLTVTVAVECLLAAVLGVRKPKALLLVALVNIVTNPVVNILLDALYLKAPYLINAFTVSAVELCAVSAEGYMYRGRLETGKTGPFLMSLILNAASFAAGILISLTDFLNL